MSKKYSRILLSNWLNFFLASLLLSNIAGAQISVNPLPYSYSQSFNSYAGSAASMPTGWTAASTNFRGAGTGISNAGGAYAYGSGGDFALGALCSGSNTSVTYTVSFVNGSSQTITSITFSWNYEQWRYASSTPGFNCTGTGALAANAVLNAKDFNGNTSGTSGTVTTTAVASFTLTGLSIAPGGTFGITWNATDQSGNDNGIAVDDFTMDITAPCTVPSISTPVAPASQSVCQNLSPANLTVGAAGTSPITYQWYSNFANSNSGGTSVGAANGGQTTSYTPSSTIVGTTYYYCVASGCSGSTAASAAVAVTVNAPPSATISYPGTPFCSDAGLQIVTRTGTIGGAYSNLPATGLSINASTGEIDPALSTAGTHTVRYTMAASGGCASQFTTTSVTITQLPAASISYTRPLCKTAGSQNVTFSGTGGGLFTAAPAGLSISSGSGAVLPSSSTEGTYIVTYTMTAPGNGCTVNQTAIATVAIKSTATSITPAAIQDLSVNNDGTVLTVNEGDIPVSRQWKYGITPGGPYTINLGTSETQIPNFSSTGTYYIVCVSTYPATPCGGGTITSNEVRINVSNNIVATTPSAYGPFCNNTINPVTVNFTYSPSVNFTAGVTTFTAQLSNGAGSFASPTNIGNVASNASGAQAIAAVIPAGIVGGTAFRIRVISTGPNSIGTDNDNDFAIGEYPTATISYPGSPYCTSAGIQSVNHTGVSGGTYSSTAGLVIDPLTASITPATSTPGTYTVTYSMPAAGTCPAQNTTATVAITALPAASISYTASPFCSNSGVQTVTRTGTAGGTYTSASGLSINSSTGSITPASSTAGTYIVTYTMPAAGGCALQTEAASVTITQAPSANISYTGNPFCSNDFTVKTITQTGTTGGTYTASPAGLSLNASTGQVSIFASTTGTYTVTYSLNPVGGCPVQTATANFTINAAPVVADISGTTTIALSGTSSLSDITPGGIWSSTNTTIATVSASGLVTASNSNAGTTIIKYTVTSGACSNAASTAINVINTSTGVDLWTNPITNGNPSATNPYTTGDVVNGNLTVSGITYAGVSSNAGSDRFNTTNWDVSPTVNTGKYISFTLTPDAGYAIDFISFIYTGQASGTGPAAITIRSSVNGYGSDIGSPTVGGTTISLGAAAYQNITSPITFRVYGSGASGASGTFSINDFTFRGNMRVLCTAPTAIEFLTQPTDVAQDASMAPVYVRAKCSSGITAAAYTGPVVLSVLNGCGYVTQTVNAVDGIAKFENIVFTRSAQSNVKLQAFAAGFTSVQSNTFNVTAPGGTPATTTIASENFESGATWAYTTGTPVVVGSGGSSGSDVISIKTFSGNKSLVKSYSVDNSSGDLGTTNTITFANQVIASSYNHATFSFQLASLGSGVGAGHDNGDQLFIEISLDGGTQWSKLLTYTGNSDHLFSFASSPVETLAYNANASYAKPSAQSAFSVSLPSGTPQFRFRITATNNRSNENWAIDNILLTGTANAAAGITNSLPVVTNDNIIACPNSNSTITLVTANTVGVVSYVWSPATFISSTVISNPVVNPPAGAVYTATITDAEGCSANGTYTIAMPGGTAGTWYGTNNSDWFQCGNWGAGIVPTNATDVTIPAAAVNVAEIDPLSAYAATYSGIARANNITVDNNTLRLQSNANLNIAGNLVIQNSGLLDMSNGGQVDLAGSWLNSVGAAGFVSGTGTVNYAAGTPQTIAAENYYNLVSSSTGSRLMVAGGTVGVAGAFTKGTNTYSFGTNNTVNYNGTAAQAIAPFTAGTTTGVTYQNLTVSNTGVKSLTGATDVEGDLSLNNSIQLALGNNYLTLKSTAGKTARVAPVSGTSTISYGTGRFVIERYYPGKRVWRLVTAPVTVDAGRSFFSSWQVGAASPVASGTYITGPSETAANGLDVSPQHNFSLKTFNQITGQFDGVTNTKSNLISGTAGIAGIPDNVGYFMFVRGDRTPANVNAFNPYGAVTETTLRDTGRIQTQSYTFPVSYNAAGSKYILIGNPYASPVDFALLSKSGIANRFRAWDPSLNSVGGYATVDLSAGVTVVPVGAVQTQIIQSKQAFLVEATNASPAVQFNENSKSSVNNLAVFRPGINPVVSLAVNLHTVNADGTAVLADGMLVQYDNGFSDKIDQLDAIKFSNINETFSIKKSNGTLMLERRKQLAENDTIFLDMKKMRQVKYRLNFIPGNFIQTGLTAYLEDSYLNTSTPVNVNGDSWVDFEVTAEAASAATGRFYIIFKKAFAYTLVKAGAVKDNVAVAWHVSNEKEIKRYEIERSADGIHFAQIGKVDIIGAAAYSWLDVSPAAGVNYYRIKGIGLSGTISYSDPVKVKVAKENPAYAVFPNPVRGRILRVHLADKPAGPYTFKLVSNLGQVLVSKKLQHPGGTATYSVDGGNNFISGLYDLEITEPGNKINTLKIMADR
ncbi:MAG: hypothetical protein QM791_09665 [Ferruginibacter sp.]